MKVFRLLFGGFFVLVGVGGALAAFGNGNAGRGIFFVLMAAGVAFLTWFGSSSGGGSFEGGREF